MVQLRADHRATGEPRARLPRRIVLGATAGALLCLAEPVAAQSYPAQPIHLIVAVPAGGPTDLLARLIGQNLTAAWGQPVIVENRPGAGQLIGTGVAAKATPDGHTLLMTTNVFAVNPFLYKSLPYDPVKDFIPVTEVASSGLVLVVNPSLAVTSLRALIDHAKAEPGHLNYGSSGPSSSLRLAAELLNAMAGIDTVHVPYDGAAPMMAALLGGEVQLAIIDMSTAKPQIKAGRLRALAVTGAQRSLSMPDIPTMSEAGLPGYTAESWFGLMAPTGTPSRIVSQIATQVAAILQSPDIRQRLQDNDETAIGSSPAGFAAFIAQESTKWGKIIKDQNITVQ